MLFSAGFSNASLLTNVVLFDFRFKNMATIQTMQPGQTQSADQTKTTTTTYHYETTYSGNTGNDLGISTAGYRTGKHNPDEWHSANYRISYQSTADREKAGKVADVFCSCIRWALLPDLSI